MIDQVETTKAPEPHAAHGIAAIVRRLGWGVCDQGVSSLSNFAVSAVVAKELGAERFGAFSLAFVTYSLVLNASRGLSTDPLLVRFSGPRSPAWRRAVSASTATALAVGVVAGLACIVVGLMLPSGVGVGFIALGFGLPGLTLQDSWRFAFFAVGRGARALVLDVVWTVLLLGGLIGLVIADHATVLTCMIVFGATATIASVFGLLLSGVRPRPGLALGWVHQHRDLGARYMVENIAVGGSRQLRMFVVGAVAGLVAVGEVRAAEILMGPFLVVLMGISQVAVPEASHVFVRAPRRLTAFCFGIGGVQAVVAAVWGVGMMLVLPLGLGHLLLGEIWKPAAGLLVPVTIGVGMGCFSTGATAGLRAMGASRRSLPAQISASALIVIGGGGGAFVGGALGSAWGWATGAFLGAAIWWLQLRRTLREHLAHPTATTLPEYATSEPIS